MSETKAGFVAIIGAPNAGKSTFLNAVLGEKLAIVSPKAQTTRVNLRGILTQNDVQYVFVDTPGIFKAKEKQIDRAMVQSAWGAYENADVVLFVIDATKGFNAAAESLLEGVQAMQGKKPVLLMLNKVDALNKEDLLPLMAKASEKNLFKEIFAISAMKKDGTSDVLKTLAKYLPQSPYLYDPSDLTDMPARMLAAEITREKAFYLLQQEIPYALAVETVTYEHKENGLHIHQNLLVERESQKHIVVGKNGQIIKKIGERARQHLRDLLGEDKLHLFLKVKVAPNWSRKENFLNELGITPQE